MNFSKEFKDLSFDFILLGIILRIVYFIINLFVGGNNCDEAMLSVNAASLANNMTDIAGEKLPVYFDTWIVGGQSPFATYIVSLFVKIFGLSLFSARFPSLILSIVSLYFAYLLSKEIFSDNKYQAIFCSLCACSPWLIYSSIYTLDCNYLGHLLVIAMYFLVKGVKSNKAKHYILSMLFFSLCFYCYIASVLLIPFILISLYLILIFKKRINFKNVLISVLSVVLFSLPFILWGLVVIKVIPEFELLGFSFHGMPGYVREKETVLGAVGVKGVLSEIIKNWAVMFFLFLTPNYNSFIALGSNIFEYGNLLSGLFLVLGITKMAFSIKKKNSFNFSVKLLSLSSGISILVYCALVYGARNGILYRYGILTYMLIIFETIGFAELIALLKKVNFKRFIAVYSAVSIILFSSFYVTRYMPQVDSSTEISKKMTLFGDHFYDCLKFAEDNGYEKIKLCKSTTNLMPSAYLRFYYKDKEFYTTLEETYDNCEKNNGKNVPMTKDGEITYYTPENLNDLYNYDFFIITTDMLDDTSINNEFDTKTFGHYTVVYK